MLDTLVNPSEITEVVYLPEMADKPLTLTQRMERVESALEIFHKKTAIEWTRDHKIGLSISVGTFILVAIGYFAWWQPQWKQHADEDLKNQIDRQIDTRLMEPLKQIGAQATSLAEIKGKLSEISELLKIVATNEMKHTSELSLPEFRKNLPRVGSILSLAQKEDAPKTPSLETIRQKLVEVDHNAPGYWGAAAALVNYRSAPIPALPNCLDKPLQMNVEKAEGNTVTHGPIVFNDCRLDIDSPEAADVYAQALPIADLLILHGLVVYRGGPISLPAGAVGRLVMKECKFDIKLGEEPPAIPAKSLLAGLIASQDLKSVRAF